MRNNQSPLLGRIYVAYCGDYSISIGPPASMLNLALLLKRRFEVDMTPQLAKAHRSTKQDASSKVSDGKVLVVKRKGLAYRLLSEIRLLGLVVGFNLRIYFRLIWGKDRVIITQPFYVPVSRVDKGRVFYIRRGNEPIGVIGSERSIGRFFEKLFNKYPSYELVYLVPQTKESLPYHVIPNHFNAQDHVINAPRGRPEFHIVGTWNFRKGGDRVLRCFKPHARSCVVNIFGNLGGDENLNTTLLESGFHYHGVVPRPYQYMSVGDVFVSLSRLEGMQRSMIEAMLQGCLVLAANRPDSQFASQAEGVFCADWPESALDAEKKFQSLIESINKLDREERETLGRANREFAIKNFGEDSVLEQWQMLLSNGYKDD